ncbi:MAG: hypothetical protein ACRDOL_06625 [Streptosporangiaceae bacterium]
MLVSRARHALGEASLILSRRTAYLLVGEAVRRASREGLPGVDVTGDMLDEVAAKIAGRPLGLGGDTRLAEVLELDAIVCGFPAAASPPMREARVPSPDPVRPAELAG